MISLDQYAEQLLQETLAAAEVDGAPRLEAFTQLVIERLSAAGEFDDAQVAYLRKTGLELSGWSYDGDTDVLHAFVTDWTGRTPPVSLTRTTAEQPLRRLATFLERCIDGYATKLDDSMPAWELADLLPRQIDTIKEIRLYLFSDSAARRLDLDTARGAIHGVPVTQHVWDLERLYRFDTSGLEREPITVDIEELLGAPLPCLAGPSGADVAVYLAILPGSFLADLYGRYGSRLLERNVRSFLQARGAVNKGIRETILNRPDRFLPYNNGISATAGDVSLVDLPDGGLALTSIKDLQIVNGGQTTASIHHAATRDRAALDGISVQAKLTVVRPDLIDEVVPSISKFSNTQNKVTGADFSANHPFHIQMEELSRTVWAPAPDGAQRQTRWFYERARGQYADELARAGTQAKRRQFKATCPTNQKFTKTDLARFLNTYEQRPHQVSLGAEKNFREFMLRLGERRIDPDMQWFQRLVAMAILFRSAEKIVQQQRFGGYRAQIVTYTLAKLSHATQHRIDLDEIWRQQRLSPAVHDVIADLSHPVFQIVTNPSGTVRHIGEWCKKLDCWKAVEELDWQPSTSLRRELKSVDRPGRTEPANQGLTGATREEEALITQIADVPAETWFEISRWAAQTGNLQSWQRKIAYDVGRRIALGQRPSIKQARQSKLLYSEARRLGLRLEDLPEGY
jgi:AIPR protein